MQKWTGGGAKNAPKQNKLQPLFLTKKEPFIHDDNAPLLQKKIARQPGSKRKRPSIDIMDGIGGTSASHAAANNSSNKHEIDFEEQMLGNMDDALERNAALNGCKPAKVRKTQQTMPMRSATVHAANSGHYGRSGSVLSILSDTSAISSVSKQKQRQKPQQQKGGAATADSSGQLNLDFLDQRFAFNPHKKKQQKSTNLARNKRRITAAAAPMDRNPPPQTHDHRAMAQRNSSLQQNGAHHFAMSKNNSLPQNGANCFPFSAQAQNQQNAAAVNFQHAQNQEISELKRTTEMMRQQIRQIYQTLNAFEQRIAEICQHIRAQTQAMQTQHNNTVNISNDLNAMAHAQMETFVVEEDDHHDTEQEEEEVEPAFLDINTDCPFELSDDLFDASHQ